MCVCVCARAQATAGLNWNLREKFEIAKNNALIGFLMRCTRLNGNHGAGYVTFDTLRQTL
jgi:hypothetical protein